MGIVLTVLEPPHPPEPNLVAALPPGTGRIIDVEPRLVSPRFDTLLITTRGLVVRDHVSGNFHGVPWVNFSLAEHLRQHSRHAVVTLWLDSRRPAEVAITRRMALNIASVAPVLKLNPTVNVDDIAIATQPADVVDPRYQTPHSASTAPPPQATIANGQMRGVPVLDGTGVVPRHRRLSSIVAGVGILVLAGAAGGVASIVINTDDSAADGTGREISSESVEVDTSD